jgi:multidrug efflux system membrane fusion protein
LALRADFDGVVARVYFKQFENVRAKENVMVLQDTSEIEVSVDVPESRVASSEPGLTLEERTKLFKPMVELTALPNQRFPLRITELSGTADPATRTYEVTGVFTPPEDLTVLPGMTAKVIIQIPANAASGRFQVPSNAIASEADGRPFVWRLDSESMTVEKVPVTLGEATGSMIGISGDLEEGAEIVISGVRQLRPGMRVSRWGSGQRTSRKPAFRSAPSRWC